MSTRCLTVFYDKDENEICVMYRHCDGYPDGHGLLLCQFLKDIKIVNGISEHYKGRIANGMECLAAQVIQNFKVKPGNIYIYPAGKRNLDEDYIYYVRQQNEGVTIEITSIHDDLTTVGSPRGLILYLRCI